MSENLWRVLTIACCAGMAVALYFLYGPKIGYARLRQIDKDFSSLDIRWRYTAEQAFECLERVGAEGRRLLRLEWSVDFAFIACLLGAMAAVSRSAAALIPLRYAMYGLSVLRAAADVLENTLLMRLSTLVPQSKPLRLARAAGAATSVKWLLMALWVAGLFVSLAGKAFGLF